MFCRSGKHSTPFHSNQWQQQLCNIKFLFKTIASMKINYLKKCYEIFIKVNAVCEIVRRNVAVPS